MKEAAVGLSKLPEKNIVPTRRQRWRRFFSALLSFLIAFTLIIGIFILGANKYYTSVWISGDSMLPTLQNLEFGLMNTHDYRIDKINRYQIVIIDGSRVFGTPTANHVIIKRIIALPNETISIANGSTINDQDPITITAGEKIFTLDDQDKYINTTILATNPLTNTYYSGKHACGENYVLGEDEYFVLGDNRGKSTDSRNFGYIKKSEIIGVLFLIEGRYSDKKIIEGQEVPLGRKFYSPWEFRYYY
ncbi:MAG: signal peptidase I [Bacilli bacterium]|jgi:signal peptidase I